MTKRKTVPVSDETLRMAREIQIKKGWSLTRSFWRVVEMAVELLYRQVVEGR